MNNKLRSIILAEIIDAHGWRHRRPFEFTCTEYAKSAGIKFSAANKRLCALVDAGVLRAETVMANGRRTRVFWRPEDEENYVKVDTPIELGYTTDK